MQQSQSRPSDSAEIELIRSLYDSVVPPFIMSAGFCLCGGLIVARSGDLLLSVPYVGGLIASIVRLTVLLADARRVRRPGLSLAGARTLEQRFAIAYLQFAIMLGVFGACALRLRSEPIELLTMVMIVGYGAGVAAGVGLRPRVAIWSLLIAISPAAVALIAHRDAMHVATGLFTAALLVGGIGSVRRRHRQTVADIDRRTAFATLARHDDLTGLPNRLGLREWFADRTRQGAPRTIAVHCLDLDGFKPVNDLHGHPVGDRLLIAVARRLEHAVRDTDLATRLGGDEFAVIQFDVDSEAQAQQLADRLVDTIARPFAIDGRELRISTSVGFVVAKATEIEMLLSLADEALYDAKRLGAGRAIQLDRADVPVSVG